LAARGKAAADPASTFSATRFIGSDKRERTVSRESKRLLREHFREK